MKKLTLCCFNIFIALALLSCSTIEVKTTQPVDVVHESSEIPEEQLLDIGIRVFKPGLEQQEQDDEDNIVFPEIRIAESNYLPSLLMAALQSSGAWGAVRVVPDSHSSSDILVSGEIILSDGEALSLKIDVVDASGRDWFSKEYRHKTSRYSYAKGAGRSSDPFQSVYNQIANDLNDYRKTLPPARLVELRRVSELKYAKSFAPQIFSQHLSQNDAGHYLINRLPAAQDPMLERIRQVREREYLFVDTLQQYYEGYAAEMKKPYQQWRRESYNEVIAMRKLDRQSRNEKLLGAAAIIAGIAGAGNSSASGRMASAVAVTGGAYVLKSGIERDADSQIHIEALQELGDSFQASIEPHIIELEDRTVTLTGTVNDQYQQWRKILQDIYQNEIGDIRPKQ